MRRLTLRSTFPRRRRRARRDLPRKRLFVGADDLIFDLPTDRTLGPVQNFSFLECCASSIH